MKAFVIVALASSMIAGCSITNTANGTSTVHTSWYSHGHRTASGERFNPNGLTAAHKTLPFGTILRLTNEENGRSVTVRVNDRGPFIRGRELDVSRGAADQLGFRRKGVERLRMEVL